MKVYLMFIILNRMTCEFNFRISLSLINFFQLILKKFNPFKERENNIKQISNTLTLKTNLFPEAAKKYFVLVARPYNI